MNDFTIGGGGGAQGGNINSAAGATDGIIGQPTTRSIAAGSLLVGLGGCILIYGTIRYKRICTQLEKGYFVIGSRGIEPVIVSAITIIVVTIAVAVLFTY